jgi:hypothetical protein
MATDRNNREVEGIDEAFLLQSIKEQDEAKEAPQPAPLPPGASPTRETSKRKRQAALDYGSMFLQKNEFKTRQCVYISQRIHATIAEIVRVIAHKDVSVGGYIDNVLLQHLEMHKDEINELYKKDRKDLIE